MEKFAYKDLSYVDMMNDMSEKEILEVLERLVGIATDEVCGYRPSCHDKLCKKERLAHLVSDMQHILRDI